MSEGIDVNIKINVLGTNDVITATSELQKFQKALLDITNVTVSLLPKSALTEIKSTADLLEKAKDAAMGVDAQVSMASRSLVRMGKASDALKFGLIESAPGGFEALNKVIGVGEKHVSAFKAGMEKLGGLNIDDFVKGFEKVGVDSGLSGKALQNFVREATLTKMIVSDIAKVSSRTDLEGLASGYAKKLGVSEDAMRNLFTSIKNIYSTPIINGNNITDLEKLKQTMAALKTSVNIPLLSPENIKNAGGISATIKTIGAVAGDASQQIAGVNNGMVDLKTTTSAVRFDALSNMPLIMGQIKTVLGDNIDKTTMFVDGMKKFGDLPLAEFKAKMQEYGNGILGNAKDSKVFAAESVALRQAIEQTLAATSKTNAAEIFGGMSNRIGATKKDLGTLGRMIYDTVNTPVEFKSLDAGNVKATVSAMVNEFKALSGEMYGTTRYLSQFMNLAPKEKIEIFDMDEMRGQYRKLRDITGSTVVDFTTLFHAVRETRGISVGTNLMNELDNIGTAAGYGGEGLQKFKDQAYTLRDIFDRVTGFKPVTVESVEKFGDAFNRIDRSSAESADASINKLMAKLEAFKTSAIFQGATIPPPSMDVGPLSSKLRELSGEADQTKVNMLGLANGMRLNEAAMAQLMQRTGLTREEIQIYGKAADSSARSQYMLAEHSKNVKNALGPVGVGFRDVTMQLYWASLGFLFLTMTMLRVEQAAVRTAQKTFSLSQSYYNLIRATRAAKEAQIEYGSGSREAGEAVVSLQMAEQQLELQKKQTALATRQEAIQEMQMTFSTIPLYVNTIWLLWTGYAQLTSGIKTAIAMKVRDSAVTNQGALATMKTVQVKIMEKGVVVASIPVMQVETITRQKGIWATMLDTVRTWLLANAKQALTTAMIPLIGIIIAVATSTMVMAIADAQATEAMNKLNAEAESQGNSWGDLANGIDVVNMELDDFTSLTIEGANATSILSDELAGKSLDKSAIRAAAAMKQLNNSVGGMGMKNATSQLRLFTGLLDAVNTARSVSEISKVSKGLVGLTVVTDNVEVGKIGAPMGTSQVHDIAMNNLRKGLAEGFNQYKSNYERMSTEAQDFLQPLTDINWWSMSDKSKYVSPKRTEEIRRNLMMQGMLPSDKAMYMTTGQGKLGSTAIPKGDILSANNKLNFNLAPTGAIGGSLIININGANVKNDDDIYKLANATADTVDKVFQRRIGSMGGYEVQ